MAVRHSRQGVDKVVASGPHGLGVEVVDQGLPTGCVQGPVTEVGDGVAGVDGGDGDAGGVDQPGHGGERVVVPGAAGQYERACLPAVLVGIERLQNRAGTGRLGVGGAVRTQGIHLVQPVQDRQHHPVSDQSGSHTGRPFIGIDQTLHQQGGQGLTGAPLSQRDPDRDGIALGTVVDEGEHEFQGQDSLPRPGSPRDHQTPGPGGAVVLQNIGQDSGTVSERTPSRRSRRDPRGRGMQNIGEIDSPSVGTEQLRPHPALALPDLPGEPSGTTTRELNTVVLDRLTQRHDSDHQTGHSDRHTNKSRNISGLKPTPTGDAPYGESHARHDQHRTSNAHNLPLTPITALP